MSSGPCWTDRSKPTDTLGRRPDIVQPWRNTAASTARGRATRQRIVTAAAELMLANGVAATSVDDVLCRSHASKSQLYHYFTDRQDLVLAVTQHACSLVLGAQKQLATIADWDDLAACFDRIVDTRSNRITRLGCPLGTLAGELAATDERARNAARHRLHRLATTAA